MVASSTARSEEIMSDKPDKKKNPMTSEDADRIEESDAPQDFKDRARKAANKNEKKN